MFFSIVIPVYNAQKYIKRCIHSILEQNFTDYEIILINDGSTDNSNEICNDFCNESIRLFYTNHIGASGARNVGIKNSRGKYLLFIDADDTIENIMLEQLYLKLRKRDIDVCYMNRHYVIENNVKSVHVVFTDNKINRKEEYSPKQFLEIVTSGKNVFPGSMWLIVCNRNFVLKNKIWLDEKAEWSEDSDFSYNLFIHAKGIIYCDYIGYNWYRDNEDSLSKQIDLKKIVSRMDVYRKWYLYFKKNLQAKEKFPLKLRKRMMQRLLNNYCIYLYQLGLFDEQKINDELYEKFNMEKEIWGKCKNRKVLFYRLFGLRLGIKKNKVIRKLKNGKDGEKKNRDIAG